MTHVKFMMLPTAVTYAICVVAFGVLGMSYANSGQTADMSAVAEMQDSLTSLFNINALESSGTVTSALIPWNTCGVYILATLGVSTFEYFPYALFNIIMPIMTVVMAYMGLTIAHMDGTRFASKKKAA